MRNRIRTTIFALALLHSTLSGCGGGGGSQDAQLPPPPIVLECPANKVQVGDVCQCPVGLIENADDGYCTDAAVTVLRGAEYLEPGFPVAAPTFGGSGYLPLYVKAANIDDDPQLEIFHKRVSTDFWGWNHDGSVLNGYPVFASTFRHGKMVFAELDGDDARELFVAHEGTAQAGDGCELNAFDQNGQLVSGFPLGCTLGIKYQPVVVDFDANGISEIVFIDEGDSLMQILENGSTQRPFGPDYAQTNPLLNLRWCGLAAADLNDDDTPEIVGLSCPYAKQGVAGNFHSLYAYDASGKEVPGFPVEVTSFREHQPLIGDVDGDQLPEIVTMTQSGIAIISNTGAVQAEFGRPSTGGYPGASNYPFLALADLTGDGVPEIMYQQGGVHAVTASGAELEGFPLDGSAFFAVGDIDGRAGQEVVTFTDFSSQLNDDPRVAMRVYGADGALQNFEIVIDLVGEPGAIMPTIADVDIDGRNEIIVASTFWNGHSDIYPQIWVFDLGGSMHGAVEWGEKYGNERNAGAHWSADN